MKATIITLGITLLTLTNSVFAGTLNDPSIRKYQPLAEETVSVPVSIFTNAYSRSIEEVIAEDNKVIGVESQEEETPLYKRSIEEIIAENNQIIESTVSNETFPLDFSKIDRKPSLNAAKDKIQL